MTNNCEAQPWGYEVLGAKHNRLLGCREHELAKYENRTPTRSRLGGFWSSLATFMDILGQIEQVIPESASSEGCLLLGG